MSGDKDNNIETIVAEAVKAKVGTMVMEALGSPGELVRAIVHEALTMKVNQDRSGYGKQVPMIHRIVQEAVVQEAQNVMKEWVEEQRPAIRKELAKRIQADRDSIAAALIDSLGKAAGNRYGMRVTFVDPKDGDER